jgi:L-lactate dehydrogenase complex protein LldE
MHNNGLRPEAAALARRMIGVFEHASHVVTPSGSCAAMVHHYPEVLADDPAWHARAVALAGKAFEFNQFLMDVLRVDVASLGGRWDGDVAYHPACHLRTIGMHGRADAPLRGVPGVRVSPLDNADQCCGFGGLFAVKQPELSGALAQDKAAAIARTGARTLVCNDAGCSMNIEGACRRQGMTIRVRTSAEVIAESLGLLPREGA